MLMLFVCDLPRGILGTYITLRASCIGFGIIDAVHLRFKSLSLVLPISIGVVNQHFGSSSFLMYML